MENTRLAASLDLLRFKLERELAQGFKRVDIEELNEVFIVAGLPVVVPEDVNKKDIHIIGEEA